MEGQDCSIPRFLIVILNDEKSLPDVSPDGQPRGRSATEILADRDQGLGFFGIRNGYVGDKLLQWDLPAVRRRIWVALGQSLDEFADSILRFWHEVDGIREGTYAAELQRWKSLFGKE